MEVLYAAGKPVQSFEDRGILGKYGKSAFHFQKVTEIAIGWLKDQARGTVLRVCGEELDDVPVLERPEQKEQFGFFYFWALDAANIKPLPNTVAALCRTVNMVLLYVCARHTAEEDSCSSSCLGWIRTL